MAGEQFQVSGSAAETYERNNVPLSFGPWADILVEQVDLADGMQVLDVACGTGVVARKVAPVVGARGRTVGVDLNEDMLAEAARHVPPGVTIEWSQGDAQILDFADSSFDLVFCHQALQYIPDRAGGVAEMCRVLRDRGTAAATIWRSVEHNPIQRTFSRSVATHVSPEAAGLFASAYPVELDDKVVLEALFAGAGFGDVRVEQVELAIPAESARHRMTGPVLGTPIAPKIKAMDPGAYEVMVNEMLDQMATWTHADGSLHAPTAANVIIATK